MSKRADFEESKKKWEELRELLKKRSHSPPSLAQDVREMAARKYEEFLATLPLRQRKLYFVTLALAPYPTAVPREKIPEMIRTSPEFYEEWAKVVVE